MSSRRIVDAQRQRVQQILDESDDEDLGGSSSGEEDHVSEPESGNSDTETEIDSDDSEDNEQGAFFLSKDGATKWMKDPVSAAGRRRRQNILTEDNEVRGPALQAKTPIEFFKCFFTVDIIDIIVESTNIKIRSVADNYARDRGARETTREEILALMGILIMAGVYRNGHINLRDLWAADGSGVEYFRATMSLYRFRFLMQQLRFDNIETREERRAVDKLAPVREFFEIFNANCAANYSPSECCTIDEMLVKFRGNCPFRQYIPSKPGKYGLKIQALCDALMPYTMKMEIYAGTQPEGPYKISNAPLDLVQRLVQCIRGTGRSVAMDNWFTSLALFDILLKDYNLTAVGTVRKNKREIPPQFINAKGREPKSTIFGYQKDKVLLSYVPKKNKCVLLMSTQHNEGTICEASGTEMKPDIIMCYNETKGGVDTVDKMNATYPASRNTRRWSQAVYFQTINVAGINALVLYSCSQEEQVVRRTFLREIAMALSLPYVQSRAEITSLNIPLRKSVKRHLRAVTNDEESSADEADIRDAHDRPVQADQNPEKKQARCGFCPRKKDKKVFVQCCSCDKFVCPAHRHIFCTSCGQNDAQNLNLPNEEL
ncbi:hypothetical protein B566_EDAN014644 [Ephemera danica]|nr:hypothetical protein B566_EDAN014644 [Ephemera danica]